MARCRLSIVREVRRCVLGHVRLCRADDGAWPRLRFRPAVGPSAAVRRTVNHVRLQVAKALLAGSAQLEALSSPVGYRRKLAATELARAPYPLFPAPFCGALSARSSICASLACNTPMAPRAMYPHATYQAGQRKLLSVPQMLVTYNVRMAIPRELQGQKYFSLTTFRKNGVGVATPVIRANSSGASKMPSISIGRPSSRS